jgi:DNA polymerase (family 10)
MKDTNYQLAKMFREIAAFLEMEEIPFKPIAYEKAAFALESMTEDVSEIYKKEGFNGLKKIPGVGESIAKKIEEYLKTGKIKYYLTYKKKYPIDILSLIEVEGVGPKMVLSLWKNLKVKNLRDLERVAKEQKIRNLPGFGEKSEENILQGIQFLKKSKGRFLLGDILPVAKELESYLKSLKEIKKISLTGSIRRKKETIGDVDVLVVTNYPGKVMDYFVKFPDIVKIYGRGRTKSSVRLRQGFDVDLRVVGDDCYGAALQYFTGSKEHNIVLRKIAIEKGYKLNEYGLFRGKKKLISKEEKDIYNKLGLEWITPELRENRGEIEAAQKEKLPELIDYNDIKGDLHCHSNWNGGKNSILELVERAMEMGYEYLGISDHTKFLKIEKGLDEKKLLEQNRTIQKINKKFEKQGLKFRILHGCEANIMPDGSLDIDNKVLAQLDYVIAGVHSRMKMPKKEMTKRIIKAMQNPNVDIISHPTGRVLQQRDEYEVDFEKILEVARKTGTILEINAYPDRLDLNDVNIKRAKEAGVKMVINTDSHHVDHLRFMELGIAQARRGWAERKDIINTQPLERLLEYFKG